MTTCPSSVSSLLGKVVRREKAVPEYCGLYNRVSDYVELQRSRFFFLKSHILGPDDRNLPIFFPSVVYPLYLHVIIDLGHIWGPFMAEIDKMCPKSAFLVVPDFGYPQSRGPP